MSGAMDLAATLSIDTSGFVQPIERAAEAAVASGEKTIEAIRSQEQSWTELANSAVPDINRIQSAVVDAAARHEEAASDMATVTDEVNRQTAAVGNHSRSWSKFGSDSVKATRTTAQHWGDLSVKIGLGLRLIGMFVPKMQLVANLSRTLTVGGRLGQLVGKTYDTPQPKATPSPAAAAAGDTSIIASISAKASTVATETIAANSKRAQASITEQLGSVAKLAQAYSLSAAAGAILYKAGIDEVVSAGAKWLKTDGDIVQGLVKTGASLGNLVGDFISFSGEGIQASVESLLRFTTGFDSIGDVVDAGGKKLGEWSKAAAAGAAYARDAFQEASLVFTAAIGIFQGGASFDASGFIEEGRRLNELAEQTQKTTAKQQSLKGALEMINESAGKAAQKQSIANDLARISSIESVAAIEAEIQAMKLLAVNTDEATRSKKSWKQEQSAKAEALGKRKEELEHGAPVTKANDAVEKTIEDATKKLLELEKGQGAVAIATAQANGANEEQLQQLSILTERIAEVTEAKKEQKKAEEEAERAEKRSLEESERNFKTWEEKIAKTLGEVMEKTGELTKEENAYNEALRNGATEAQAEQYGKLAQELEDLKDEEKKGKSGGKHKDENKATMAGSSEAAKIALAGINGGKNKLEDLGKKQIDATKDVVKAINDLEIDKPTPGVDI